MIFILEDDESIRELLVYALGSAGFEAEGFSLPSQLEKKMKTQIPRLLILDIMLPEEDGVSVLKKLRAKSETADLPVIMLTAKSTEFDKIVGLDAGADDYMTKPFGVMELVARVKALLRRSKKTKAKEEYTVGNIVLNVKHHSVKVNDEPVVLTLKEYELLECLMKNKGVVFSRDSLLESIWGYEFDGESRTIDVHVRTLRQKLGEGEKYIETIRGVGYKIREDIYEK